MKFAFSVFLVALLHFFATFMLAFILGTTGGGPFLKALSWVLTFPLSLSDGPDNLHPLLGWGAWFGLSLLWGWAICALVRHFLGAGR